MPTSGGIDLAATKLTDKEARKAAPGKHFDGRGLFLHVTETGARYWRLKYRFGGKEKLLALGVFDEVSLKEARRRCDDAKRELRDGIDPNVARAARQAERRRNTGAAFPTVATNWLAFKRKEWAPETYRKAEYVLDTYLTPALRRESLATMTTKVAADALQKIPPSLASKARQYLGGIVNHAIREGLRDDGRLLSLRGAVPKSAKSHIPAATDLADVRRVVSAVSGYPVPVTRAALLAVLYTAQRPGTVVTMEWSELDLEAAEWSIPAAKMKTRNAHLVPLPEQAVDLLRTMEAYTLGKRFVFPPLARQTTDHLHRDALSNALRRLGLKGLHATHGFRGMFRTVARERLNLDPDVLEAQLAHAKRGDVQKAYDRTKFDDARRTAMQQWADYVDGLSSGAKVVRIRRGGR